MKKETVATALAVCPRMVGKWGETGRIPVHRLGRRCVRYRMSEVLTALGVESGVTQ